MGIADRDLVPGLRVRHRDGWTGTAQRLGTPGVAEITPDGGSGPRWFYLSEFTTVDWHGGPLPERVPIRDWDGAGSRVPRMQWGGAPVPETSEAERRYMLDPGFHQLVTYQLQLLQLASYADLRAATDLAIRIDSDRKQRDGIGRSPIQDVQDHLGQFDRVAAERSAARLAERFGYTVTAADDVRGRERGDAQEERGTHEAAEPEPGRPGTGAVYGDEATGGLPDHDGRQGHGDEPGHLRGGPQR